MFTEKMHVAKEAIRAARLVKGSGRPWERTKLEEAKTAIMGALVYADTSAQQAAIDRYITILQR